MDGKWRNYMKDKLFWLVRSISSIYNWDLFVLGPALAILSMPRPVCCSFELHSSRNGLFQMDFPPRPVPVGSPPWIWNDRRKIFIKNIRQGRLDWPWNSWSIDETCFRHNIYPRSAWWSCHRSAGICHNPTRGWSCRGWSSNERNLSFCH